MSRESPTAEITPIDFMVLSPCNFSGGVESATAGATARRYRKITDRIII
jgi:hypothetical protein